MNGSKKVQQLIKSACKFSLLASLLSPVLVSGVFAQSDFTASALAALGNRNSSGIEFTAEGWDACMGQAYSVKEGWARWELTEYRRLINFDDGSSSHSAMRRAGMDPDKVGGCGAQPGSNPGSQSSFVDSSGAWSAQLAIWLTPQGFIQLLDSGEPTIVKQATGWKATLPVSNDSVTYTLIGNFNNEHELLSIQTWIDDSVFGDMEVLAEFGEYKDFGGITFPSSINIKQGGFTQLSLDIHSAALSNEVLQASAPRRGGGAATATGPAYVEIGDGIFAFHGGYQSVAVEFDHFIVVLDGLQNDARVQELIALVKEAIPGKPIRYVLSTHSHFDHASGLRQFAAEGAVILTHAMNVEFFQKALSTPRTLRSNPIEPNEVPVLIQGVEGRFVISDGAGKTVELYSIPAGAHAADQVIAYLPSIKTIVEADMLQPWINPVFGGNNGPHPFLVYLAEELDKTQIDYERFVPIHVPPTPPLMERADLEAVLNQ